MNTPIACGNCGTEMIPGRVRIKGSVRGFLFVGLSWQHLWWSDPEESRPSRERLMTSGDVRAARRCPSCGMVAFLPADQRP